MANKPGKGEPLWLGVEPDDLKRGDEDLTKCNCKTEVMQHQGHFGTKKLQDPKYQFFAAVQEGCLPCLLRHLELDPSCLGYESDTNHYNAMDFAISAHCWDPTHTRALVGATLFDAGCRPNHYTLKPPDKPADEIPPQRCGKGAANGSWQWRAEENSWQSTWWQPTAWAEAGWHGLDPRQSWSGASTWQSNSWKDNKGQKW